MSVQRYLVCAVLFKCVQYYLCTFNVVYTEVSNKRPPSYYFWKFDDPPIPPTPSIIFTILQDVY